MYNACEHPTVMATSVSGSTSRSRCLLYRSASKATSSGWPLVRVYWCAAVVVIARRAAEMTNGGGAQSGKPCPRFVGSSSSAASAPNSAHTVACSPASALPEAAPCWRIDGDRGTRRRRAGACPGA